MKTLIKTIIATTLLMSGAAQAHYLWIESGETGARLYYGEADALLKEKSPGKLDSIKAPLAFVKAEGADPGPAVAPKHPME